jgi:Mg-chelatase subunit ChlD
MFQDIYRRRIKFARLALALSLILGVFLSMPTEPIAAQSASGRGLNLGQPVDSNCQASPEFIDNINAGRLAAAAPAWVRLDLIGMNNPTCVQTYLNTIFPLLTGYKIIGLLSNSFVGSSNVTLFTTTASSVASTFGDKIDTWEVWNEPNAAATYLEPCTFVDLFARTKAAIEAVDGTSAVVLNGGFTFGFETYVDQFVAGGCADNFNPDGFAIHPYAQYPTATQGSPGVLNDFIFQAKQLDPAGKRRDRGKPIYVTEFGWKIVAEGDTNHDGMPNAVPNETLQCQYLKAAISEFKTRGVGVAVWFTIRDFGADKYGLYDQSGNPRPARDAFAGTGSCPSAATSHLDMVFAIDTTGSMTSSIAAVKASAINVISNLSAIGIDYRIGLVEFKDHGDMYVSRTDLPFSTNTTTIVNAINALAVGGGGDTPEAVFSGVMTAVGFPWRNGAKKAIVLMGDAPPHDPEQVTNFTRASVIAAANAVDPASIYPIFIGGDSGMRTAFQALASGTGGQSFEGGANVGAALVAAVSAIARSPNAQAGGPYAGIVNRGVTFNAGASRDPDGSIVRYEWDLDANGTFETSLTRPSTVYTYTAPFSGTVTLRVTDNDGRTGIGTAAVRVVGGTNIAPSGTAYRWFSLYTATSDYQKAAAPGLTDGNLTADVELANGSDDNSNVYQGAGVVWTSAKTISAVTFINGSCDQYRNGVFVGNVGVQVSTNGTSWTAAPWTILPQYPADSCGLSPTAAAQRYIFNGPALSNIKGVRIVGLVHTAGKPASWHAHVTEVQVFQ